MSESKKPFAPGYNHTDYSAAKPDKDPCYHESQLSLKCLSENGYDKSKCGNFFQNYKVSPSNIKVHFQ